MTKESEKMDEDQKLSDTTRIGFVLLIVLFLAISGYLTKSFYGIWKWAGWLDTFPFFKLLTFVLIPFVTALLLVFIVWAPRTLLNRSALGRNLCRALILASLLSPIGFGLFKPLKVRHIDSYPKSDLHWFYSACQSYWRDKGRDQNCDLNIASLKKYGFHKSRYVSISGKGKAANFIATARNVKSEKVFAIDARGKINKVGSRQP
jgi:hypothetical protein